MDACWLGDRNVRFAVVPNEYSEMQSAGNSWLQIGFALQHCILIHGLIKLLTINSTWNILFGRSRASYFVSGRKTFYRRGHLMYLMAGPVI